MSFLAAGAGEEVGAATAAGAEAGGSEAAAAGATERGAAKKAGGKEKGGGLLVPWPEKAQRMIDSNSPLSHAPKVIVAEFIVCMVLVAITPLIGTNDTVTWMKRGFACTGLFLVLSLVASGGPRAARIAAAFGGLVTLGLCITDRAVFAQIVGLLGGGGAAADDTEDVSEINEVLGDDGE